MRRALGVALIVVVLALGAAMWLRPEAQGESRPSCTPLRYCEDITLIPPVTPDDGDDIGTPEGDASEFELL